MAYTETSGWIDALAATHALSEVGFKAEYLEDIRRLARNLRVTVRVGPDVHADGVHGQDLKAKTTAVAICRQASYRP